MALDIANADKLKNKVDDGYIINIIIDEMDYESDAKEIKIISSFNGAYPIFFITLNLKPQEVINHKILGGNTVKLEMNFKSKDGSYIYEPYKVDLIYLSGEFVYPLSNQILTNEESLQDQVLFVMKAVPADAYTVMTYTSNKIYYNTTPIDMLKLLIHQTIKESAVDSSKNIMTFDDFNINTNKPDQILFPPTILKNHIDYLLNEFAIYDQYGVIYATLDKNGNTNYNIMNIGYRLDNTDPAFKITQLANDIKKDELDEIVNNIEYGNLYDYYTYNGIPTNYIGNSNISTTAYYITYINKPVDKFVRIDDDEIFINDYMSKKYSWAEDPHIHDSVKERHRYITNHICYNRNQVNTDMLQDENWVGATANKSMMNLSQIRIVLERDLPLHLFTNIGQPIEFYSMTNEYEPLNGKYIFFSSEVTLKKASNWNVVADLKLIRPKW